MLDSRLIESYRKICVCLIPVMTIHKDLENILLAHMVNIPIESVMQFQVLLPFLAAICMYVHVI